MLNIEIMEHKMNKLTLLRSPFWQILDRELIKPIKLSPIRQDLPGVYHIYTDAVSVCCWLRNHDYWGCWGWVKT